MTSEDDPFHDCELDPEAILGTHTFENVLFTDETETPVNVLTGETSAHSQATVEEAKEFAASIDTETPQIALPASVESQVETRSKPFTAAAFFHFKATGSIERHRAYHAAYESNTFTVDFKADYASGDLTITVKEADKAN
ncbi:hypothetical protein [Haloarcula nitratireducens]|uniref:DUF8025 domain-containing protein n=1 Tax=Haloarcula nitratireducens TaxID=2487749 RepID=A0AAW4PI24_9EURY|nr:hypothetical protein [Halomicroarcula nitratireducens]MBX0296847.1 hypothetical protein [Halomicroarcula nitratireducens]